MNQVMPPVARRVDPRRPFIVTPAGLRRIVLGSLVGHRDATAPAAAPAAPAARPVRSTGPFNHCIAAVVHADRGTLDDHARETIAAAALLATPDTEVVAMVIGECRDDAAALGIDRLVAWPVADAARLAPVATIAWLARLAERLRPQRWLLPDRGAEGELGRRFAVDLGLELACGVVELQTGAGGMVARQRYDARQDLLRAPAAVMLLARHVAQTALPFVGLGRSETEPDALLIDAGRYAVGVQDLGIEAGDPQTLALEEADLIFAAGNGVTDLQTFQALAEVAGAATGASRVAVDDGRFPRSKQIGATGRTVSASAYLALGISGAVQHLQGIKDCRHVIAVNLDPAAPIARRAALTVVEDSGRFMQALLGEMRAAKGARQ